MTQQYFDTETRVFFNKLGIENQKELELLEYKQTAIRTDEILSNPQLIKTKAFNLDRQKEIHAHLLGDIYEWAGKIRTVPSRKLNDNREMAIFDEPEQIEPNWQKIEQQCNEFLTSRQGLPEKVEQLAEILAQINQTHAFVEGNGRTTQIFMKQLAERQNIELDYTKVNPDDWNLACSQVCERHKTLRFEGQTWVQEEQIPVDKQPLKAIFANIASEKIRNIEQRKQQYQHAKYQYETALSMLPESEQHAMRENEKVARAMFAFIENPQDKLNAMLKFYQTNTEQMNRDINPSPQNIDDAPETDR